jgi:hypothetical protein
MLESYAATLDAFLNSWTFTKLAIVIVSAVMAAFYFKRFIDGFRTGKIDLHWYKAERGQFFYWIYMAMGLGFAIGSAFIAGWFLLVARP